MPLRWLILFYYQIIKAMEKDTISVISKGIPITTHKYNLLDTGGFIVDIKYQSNISSMSPLLRRDFTEHDPKVWITIHLPDEAEALFALRDKVIEKHNNN